MDDQEAAHPFVEAFVVSELSRLGSNFRMNMSLNDYMIENKTTSPASKASTPGPSPGSCAKKAA
ncbi:hypothetical protein ACXO2X_06555 [Lactobacillus delbrueckii subsp. bulgaricus]